jgi:hypothetical protein
LIAINEIGYKNLVRLVTDSHLEGFYYKPRIDKELIEKYNEGLIAISPSFSGEIAQSLKSRNQDKAKEVSQFYKKIFYTKDPDTNRLFIEITRHPEIDGHEAHMQKLVSFARDEHIPIMAAHDVYYIHPEDRIARETLARVNSHSDTGEKISDSDDDDFSFISPDKAKELFKEYKNKYDFVKYLYPLRPSLYDSVMMIAKQEGVKVAGHGPKGGIEAALKAKQTSIEHIDLFLREYKKDSLEFNKRIAQMAEAGIFSCPDVDWYYINWNQLKIDELKKRGGIEFLPPSLVDQWVSYSDKMHLQALEKNKEQFLNGIKTGKENLELFSKLLKKLNDARVPLLISAGDGYFIVPGYSFYFMVIAE